MASYTDFDLDKITDGASSAVSAPVGFKAACEKEMVQVSVPASVILTLTSTPPSIGTSEDYSAIIQRRPEACSDFGTSLYEFIDDATDLPIAVGGITPGTTSFDYDSSLFDFYGQVDLIVRLSDTLDPLFFVEITIILLFTAPIATPIATPSSNSNWHPNYPPYFLR